MKIMNKPHSKIKEAYGVNVKNEVIVHLTDLTSFGFNVATKLFMCEHVFIVDSDCKIIQVK